MEFDRSEKRSRRPSAGEGDGSSNGAASDAGELSMLERLHPDVLAEVLQRLGPVEASPVRLVSSSMRRAVDSVRWRSLRIEAGTAAQLERVTEFIVRSVQLQTAGARRILLAAGCMLDVRVRLLRSRPERTCISSLVPLLTACSASSGGLGSLSVRVIVSDRYLDISRRLVINDQCSILDLLAGALDVLSAPEANGGSRDTLTRFSLDAGVDRGLPILFAMRKIELFRRLSLFPRLQHLELQLPFRFEPDPQDAACPNLLAALPALRSVVLRDPAILPAFASHTALRELDSGSVSSTSSASEFEALAAGPAARGLRKLRIRSTLLVVLVDRLEEASMVLLSSLGRFSSLEKLELTLEGHVCIPALHSDVAVRAFSGLGALRDLDLRVSPALVGDLRLARVVSSLRAKSLANLALSLERPEANAALAELLYAAGPALVELRISGEQAAELARGGSPLAVCPRLRRLALLEPEGEEFGPPLPLPAAADLLAGCPRLAEISGLPVPLSLEPEAGELLDPLRRLAAACALGHGSGCSFTLQPSASVRREERARAASVARDLIRSILPKASLRTFGGFRSLPHSFAA